MDETLHRFATDRQWEIYTALTEHGSERAAARAMGVARNTVADAMKTLRARAARAGYAPDYDQQHAAPPGFRSRGVSTLYNLKTGEPVLQWHKTAMDHDQQWELVEAFAAGFSKDLPRAKPVARPQNVRTDLMVAYPIGDHHTGMLSWHAETGADWDLKIAERVLAGAVSHLVGLAPPCEVALVAFLGDYLHFQAFEAVTPKNRNLLDAEGRFPKVVEFAVRMARATIEAAKRRHKRVVVIVEQGNHDQAMAILLAVCLREVYANDPAVEIDTSPMNIHYFRFGKNLIGTTHGDKIKLPRLPMIMASDRAKDWGETRNRYWYTGHVHHDQRKDFDGVIVESFGVLPPNDAHSQTHGYRSRRGMHSIVYHAEWGEVARHIVTPEMLEAAA